MAAVEAEAMEEGESAMENYLHEVPPQRSPAPLSHVSSLSSLTVEGLGDSLTQAELGEEEVEALLIAVGYETEMSVGDTRWARQVRLGHWELVEPGAAHLGRDGVYATVTRNILFGPKIEHILEEPSSRTPFGKVSRASSRSDAHVEVGARLTFVDSTRGEGNGEERSAEERSAESINYRAGIGVTSGGGIKDDSVSFKALGMGFSFGRRMGLSFLDSEVDVDLLKGAKSMVPGLMSSPGRSPGQSPGKAREDVGSWSPNATTRGGDVQVGVTYL